MDEQTRTDWPALLEFVLGCEDAGIDSFWVPDHPTGFPDPWVTLAALAATTRRIRPGIPTPMTIARL